MIKLKDILNEIAQLYKVDAYIVVDNEYNVTDILNNMRAIRKITTINNNTSDELEAKNKQRTDNKSVHTLGIKIMSGAPEKDLEFLKKTMMRSKQGDPNARVPGLLFIKFKPETLTKTS